MTIFNDFSYSEDKYRQLQNFIENSYMHVSFFGYRNVYSLNYEGCIELRTLVKKIIDFIGSNPKFCTKEFIKVDSKTSDKLWNLYDISEDQTNKANLISYFFLIIFSLLNFTDSKMTLVDYLQEDTFSNSKR